MLQCCILAHNQKVRRYTQLSHFMFHIKFLQECDVPLVALLATTTFSKLNQTFFLPLIRQKCLIFLLTLSAAKFLQIAGAAKFLHYCLYLKCHCLDQNLITIVVYKQQPPMFTARIHRHTAFIFTHAYSSQKRYSLQNQGCWAFLYTVQVEGLPLQPLLPRTQ